MFDTELWSTIFRNKNVDVRPYFLYTTHDGRRVEANLNFLGFGERKISNLATEMNKKLRTHIGGINAELIEIYSRKMKFERIELEDKLTLRFRSPIALMSETGNISLLPQASQVLTGLTRSVNRFTKYYAKPSYPIRIKTNLRGLPMPINESNLKVFTWKHKAIDQRTISLKGVWGDVTYELPRNKKELADLLSLASFFQVGKWLSYGFGKIEVIENE